MIAKTVSVSAILIKHFLGVCRSCLARLPGPPDSSVVVFLVVASFRRRGGTRPEIDGLGGRSGAVPRGLRLRGCRLCKVTEPLQESSPPSSGLWPLLLSPLPGGDFFIVTVSFFYCLLFSGTPNCHESFKRPRYTVDHLARGSMKNAANCASECELQDI